MIRKGGQEGFTLLELLIVMSILGILAMVAVPKFNQALALANTTKIQTDLRTLNTAITLYQAEKSTYPASLDVLSDYVEELDKLKPPQGNCLLGGSLETITDAKYGYDNTTHQATFQGKKAADFDRTEKTGKGS